MSFYPPSLSFPSTSILEARRSRSVNPRGYFFAAQAPSQEQNPTQVQQPVQELHQNYESLWYPKPKNPLILSHEHLQVTEHALSIQKRHIRKYVHYPDVLVQNTEIESDIDDGTDTEGLADSDDEYLTLDTSPIQHDNPGELTT